MSVNSVELKKKQENLQEELLKKNLGDLFDDFISEMCSRLCKSETKQDASEGLKQRWVYGHDGFRFVVDVSVCTQCRGLIAMYPFTGVSFRLV